MIRILFAFISKMHKCCSAADTMGQNSLLVGGGMTKAQNHIDVSYPLNLNLTFCVSAKTFYTNMIRSKYSLWTSVVWIILMFFGFVFFNTVG